MDIVTLSKELMYKQTQKNKAPAWMLTELAVEKGDRLSKKYDVDERLVLTSLYLAHTVFSSVWNGDVQRNHPKLSSEFAKCYLEEWNVDKDDQEIILNAIEAHHNAVPTKTKVAEVVKNAECFKFVTVEGSLIMLHMFGLRGLSFTESVNKVMQKIKLLTLSDCVSEAKENCRKIEKIFKK